VGSTGPTGATGAQGEQGQVGARGVIGESGAVGDRGAAGIEGERGVAGIQGEAGARGAIGATGALGLTGLQGIQGIAGSRGERGPQGEPGVTIVIHEHSGVSDFSGGATKPFLQPGAPGGFLPNSFASTKPAAPIMINEVGPDGEIRQIIIDSTPGNLPARSVPRDPRLAQVDLRPPSAQVATPFQSSANLAQTVGRALVPIAHKVACKLFCS